MTNPYREHLQSRIHLLYIKTKDVQVTEGPDITAIDVQ